MLAFLKPYPEEYGFNNLDQEQTEPKAIEMQVNPSKKGRALNKSY